MLRQQYYIEGKKKTMRLDVGVFPLRTVYKMRGKYPSLSIYIGKRR